MMDELGAQRSKLTHTKSHRELGTEQPRTRPLSRVLLLLLRLVTKVGQVPTVHTADAQFMLLKGEALYKDCLYR